MSKDRSLWTPEAEKHLKALSLGMKDLLGGIERGRSGIDGFPPLAEKQRPAKDEAPGVNILLWYPTQGAMKLHHAWGVEGSW